MVSNTNIILIFLHVRIDSKSCEALEMVLNKHSTTDEYLVSLQPKNNTEGQHYVCIAFKPDGVPDIVHVTKHNRKDWMILNFDILCLHRYIHIIVIIIPMLYKVYSVDNCQSMHRYSESIFWTLKSNNVSRGAVRWRT